MNSLKYSIILLILMPLLSLANLTSVGEHLYASDDASMISDFYDHSGWRMGSGILIDIPEHDDINHMPLEINHIGFFVSSGYGLSVSAHNVVGASLQYSKFGNIFLNTASGIKQYSFNNMSLLVWNEYRFLNNILLGYEGGYGFMFGSNVNRGMPLVGFDFGIMIAKNIAVKFNYQHYFGMNSKSDFTEKRFIPHFDVLSGSVVFAFN